MNECSVTQERGSRYSYDLAYRPALERAFMRAGILWPEDFWPCHDLRVTAITNDAKAGASPTAIMVKAGHANYSTTKRYLDMAGVVFRDEAAALEARLLSTDLSPAPTEPHSTLQEPTPLSDADTLLTDAR